MILQERNNAQILEGEDPKPQEWPRDRAPAWTSLTTVAISIS
jgi:hypothetical protein